MTFFRVLLILILVSGLFDKAFSQRPDDAPRRGSRVIDDTTKQVYGPRTSRYFYEDDVFLNKKTYYLVDTVIRNFHQFNDVQRNENLYQDLGNIGTAIRPIYYDVPDMIGVTSGFYVYDVYWDREPIRHWDTKSPYTNMNVILGGRGRSVTRATYSRNINPRWNMGITYRALMIDKQIQRRAKGDRNVRSHYYDFHTTYQSKDSAYTLFANFRRQNHRVEEFGGVRGDVPQPFAYENYFGVNAQPFLQDDVESRELRMNIHLFHQYEIGKALQVYHRLDRYRQGNGFVTPSAIDPPNYFDHLERGNGRADDMVKFTAFRNEAGIKGNLLKLFYNGYYAIRDFKMLYKHDTVGIPLNRNGTESYLGGRMSLRLDSIGEVSGWVEVMDNGNYRIEGNIVSRWFEASLKQAQYAPGFAQLAYRGKYDYWQNDFSNVNATRLSGAVHYRSTILTVSPGLMFTRLGNYIFFKQVARADRRTGMEIEPVQSSGEQVFASPNLRVNLTMKKHIHLRTYAIYSRVLEEQDDAIQLPELLVNSQLSYENIFFKGNLDLHTGIDFHWKSAYYAHGYDVPTQQFYIQTGEAAPTTTSSRRQAKFISPAFPVIDIFLNAKIKRGRIFFKYNNLMQLITKEGYFPTPHYVGQRNVIDFGFDWSFYD